MWSENAGGGRMSKKLKPFLAHSELTDCIYIIDGNDKYEVTEQCIKAMKATNRLPKMGQWIKYVTEVGVELCTCSVCRSLEKDMTAYCPNCGSKNNT